MKIIRPTAITDSAGSFTRSTTATYFDKDGILQTAAINVPRVNFIYNNIRNKWQTNGVLLEQAATNLSTYSEQFDNDIWVKVNSTVSTNLALSPNNTTTADKLVESAANGAHVVYIARTATNETATFSVFMKQAEKTFVKLEFSNFASASCGAVFDLSTGNITEQDIGNADYTNPVASILYVGNGWYRCRVTVTKGSVNTTNHAAITLRSADGSLSSYTGDGTSGVYLWGAQLELGSTLTSYIPTTTVSVTRTADTVTGTGFIYSSIPETDYAAWVSGTTYSLGDRVIRTTATTHSIYERVVAGAGTTAPESDPNNWIRVGPTNRWSVFDDSPSTISSQPEYLTYIIKPGRINSLALLELEGTEVAVNLYAGGEQQYFAYNDLQNSDTVGNWYEYFYEPFYYQTSLALSDLVNASLIDMPQYAETILCITVRKASAEPSTFPAKVGIIATGIVYELGKTQNGMSVSIVDYSKKDTDTYGNTVLVRRKFSKRVRATFFLYSSKVDVVSNLLTQYRATPVVWIGADAQYSALVIYGFYRDWDIGIPNNIGSTCSIEIEGLT